MHGSTCRLITNTPDLTTSQLQKTNTAFQLTLLN